MISIENKRSDIPSVNSANKTQEILRAFFFGQSDHKIVTRITPLDAAAAYPHYYYVLGLKVDSNA